MEKNSDIRLIIMSLKYTQSPSLNELSVEYVTNSNLSVIIIISKLFNRMVVYENVPNGFGISTIFPIDIQRSCKVQ